MTFIQPVLSRWWKSSTRKPEGLFLVYQLRNRQKYYDGSDPNAHSRVEGQKRGHPLRNHQSKEVKNAHRGVTDCAYFIDVSINVAIAVLDGDLVIIHKGLHHVPHGLQTQRAKYASDMTLRDNSVSVIDVPEDMKVFCMSRVDDGVNVFRTGTSEVGLVSMTRGTKRAFLHFLIDEEMKKYSSEDSGRDVGNVHRYDLMFNQSQLHCDEYSDAYGNVIVDRDGSPLRVPFLRRQTEMLRLMPDEMKREFTKVLTGLDHLTRKMYPDAFPDIRRRELVQKYFVHDYLGEDVDMINWEYIGLIARKVTENNYLAMHLDVKNDTRKGYDYCSTYSFVIDCYRVTIIAACKSDFGSLMDRLDGNEVEGGRFLPVKMLMGRMEE